jgi:hypothetical protein
MSFSRTTTVTKLSLPEMMAKLRQVFEEFVDPRRGKNSHYAVSDAALSAFSVFFMQCPSFLDYQRTMQETQGNNNAQSLFGVHEIPSDNQIRTLLDATAPSALAPLFTHIIDGLQGEGVLDRYRFGLNENLLIALDGTQYFSSTALHCPNCLQKTQANGRTLYSHTVVTPVLVRPGEDKVIPLLPEFVTPQDGSNKQDCELTAAGRWLDAWGSHYSPLGVTVLADDLYCHEPFCRKLLKAGMDFVLVCKPESHATLYEWLDDRVRMGQVKTVSRRRWTGRTHVTDTYHFAESLPLRDADDALMVNWCELISTNETGKVLYHNAFVTSHTVEDSNVIDLVAAGRARWKVENENNNTLKTKGYHFEHNYGHGKKNLSALLATLIILAYLVHNVMGWLNEKYQALRAKLGSRQRFFNDLRVMACYFSFQSWDAMLAFMLQALENPIPMARSPTVSEGASN